MLLDFIGKYYQNFGKCYQTISEDSDIRFVILQSENRESRIAGKDVGKGLLSLSIKEMKKVIMTLAIALTMMSCAMQKTSVDEQYTQARMLDVRADAHVKPLTVEVEIDRAAGRISETWSYTKEDITAMGGDLSNIRANGLYKTAQKHSADIIVAPLFDLRTAEDGTYRLTVIGYPGNFVNWKSLEAKDSVWMSLNKFYKGNSNAKEDVDVIINYKN